MLFIIILIQLKIVIINIVHHASTPLSMKHPVIWKPDSGESECQGRQIMKLLNVVHTLNDHYSSII
jgi:hypothetical protein